MNQQIPRATPAMMPKTTRQQIVKNLKTKREDNIARSAQAPINLGTRIIDRLDKELVTRLLAIY